MKSQKQTTDRKANGQIRKRKKQINKILADIFKKKKKGRKKKQNSSYFRVLQRKKNAIQQPKAVKQFFLTIKTETATEVHGTGNSDDRSSVLLHFSSPPSHHHQHHSSSFFSLSFTTIV